MKTKAARLYAANDARLEEFELRPITDGEILIKIILRRCKNETNNYIWNF